ADPITGPGCQIGRFAFEAVKEPRIDKHAGQCVFNAGIEGPLRASCLIETEQGLHCYIRVGDRLSERTARQSPQDLLRTSKLVAGTGRTTHENTPSAWRISRPGKIEWTGN